MNGEVDYEKVLQAEFHGVCFIITIRADSKELFLQLEDKFTGQIWEGFFDEEYVERITSKAGSLKRYNVFIKMLSSALSGSSDSVHVDILTHHDLQMQSTRRNGGTQHTTDPIIAKQRYLIMSYMAEFDKVHYPLILPFVSSPNSDRLKLTIRRLSQQLQCHQSNPKTDSLIKQLSAIKHQNQLLKSKIRSLLKNQTKQNQNNNVMNKEIEEQNKCLKQELQKLKSIKNEELFKKNKIIQQKQKIISNLEQSLKDMNQNQQNYNHYDENFNKLAKQATQFAAALQHSKENEKKSQLKIANLQKQLEKMMSQLRRHQNSRSNKNLINSPRKSDTGSIRSNGSKKSLSKQGNNSKTQKINIAKNNSVFDSDTESSRFRNSGRVSPYRQSSRPLNSSKSAKKKENNRVNAMPKYSNISNLYNKDLTNKGRSRSKSKTKSIKREFSPPPSDNFESSVAMTQGMEYGSEQEDQNKVESTLAKLRNNREKKKLEQKNKDKERKNVINPIQQKISSIASLMRNLRNSTNIEAVNQN